MNLTFEMIMIYCFIGLCWLLYYLPTLIVGYSRFKNIDYQSKNLRLYGLGAILACVTYTLMYYAIATISHKVTTSKYGIAFSEFYFHYFFNFCLILFLSFFLIMNRHRAKKSAITKKWCMIIDGFQLMLVIFLLLPDEILGVVFNWLHIHDVALFFFANQNHIIDEIDIKNDLIHTSYSYNSISRIFVLLNMTAFICWLAHVHDNKTEKE